MLKDVDWAEDGTYTPQGAHTPHEFFTLGLLNSISFDLQLGYFNSATINVLSTSFASFIKRGGKMRMSINQIVSKKDKDAIIEGEKGGIEAPFDISNWESIKEGLDEYGEHFFRCLAFLIQEKRIEIKIIKPKSSVGIAHTKRGMFIDETGMEVGFNGSANFTIGGLFNNLEEISIYLSTSSDDLIIKKLNSQKETFNSIMNQENKDVEYLSSQELEEAIQNSYGNQNIDELLFAEKNLIRYKSKMQVINNMVCEDDVCYYESLPKFPYKEGPRFYQQQAFENWKNNNQKGLFAMATGTGKTLTALNCLLEIYKRCGYYKAIILVPTLTLVDQWTQECKKFCFKNIVIVCSKNHSWKSDIGTIKLIEEFNTSKAETSYIIISTYASFARENVFNELLGFPKKKLLLIADEAHNMGAGRIMDRLSGIAYLRRIGLSATPNRQYDDDGNEKILNFFGSLDRYTFEFSMEEAIQKKFLCRYYYYPHVVRLTEDEMEEYLAISLKLAKMYNYDKKKFPQGDELLMNLLLKRKRIIHKAKNKEKIFKSIIEDRFKEKGNLKYTLVYVPEGNKPDELSDIFDQHEYLDDDEDSIRLIDTYTQIVQNISEKTTVKKFTSDSLQREKLLEDFASGRLEVLTSMKCLDEGVDVPRSELAIFCASTGNPRQFIQRRGRILRMHKDKHVAYIHDLVVVPEINSTSENFRMEKNLLEGELRRVRDFASLSENASYAYQELEEILNYYNLSLF